MSSVQEERLSGVQWWVAKHGPQYMFEEGWSILSISVLNDCFLTVKWLVDTFPSLVHHPTADEGIYPLHQARSVPVAQYLLLQGKADLFALTKKQNRPSQHMFFGNPVMTYLLAVEQRLIYLKMLVQIEGLPSDLRREVIAYLVQ